jgi:hypothetical protein
MSRRGPYKRYEYDPAVCVPKRTFYRRKRQHEEIEATINTTDDSGNECNTVCEHLCLLLAHETDIIQIFIICIKL